MPNRLRHCVECPKCRTRYLVGFSPYANGSWLLPVVEGVVDEWTLLCRCATPPACSQWRWNELKSYVVSGQAYERGYGSPDEIVGYGGAARRWV
jgi:hypothetical protein